MSFFPPHERYWVATTTKTTTFTTTTTAAVTNAYLTFEGYFLADFHECSETNLFLTEPKMSSS